MQQKCISCRVVLHLCRLGVACFVGLYFSTKAFDFSVQLWPRFSKLENQLIVGGSTILYFAFLVFCDNMQILKSFTVEQSMVNFVKYSLGTHGESGFGSRSTAEEVCAKFAQRATGKKIVLTGWTSGIGYECARALLKFGAHLILVGRGDLEKLSTVAATLSSLNPHVEIIPCDLGDLSSVREAARLIISKHDFIDVLINNGGISCCPATISRDGLELQFATNAAGPFVLSELLLPLLAAHGSQQEPGRLVNVASKAHNLVKEWKNMEPLLTSLDQYSPLGGKEYAISKLCNIFHASHLQVRCSERGLHVAAFSLHPGGVATNVFRHVLGAWAQKLLLGVLGRPFLKTIPQGAATQVLLALAPISTLVRGGYYQDCNLISPTALARDDIVAKEVWELMTRLTSETKFKEKKSKTD
jgi:retinol dehydrogenase-12